MRMQIELDETATSQIEDLKQATGLKTYKDLFNNAIALLTWAIQQRRQGRVIASLDEERQEFKELQMPALEHAAQAIPAQAREGAA